LASRTSTWTQTESRAAELLVELELGVEASFAHGYPIERGRRRDRQAADLAGVEAEAKAVAPLGRDAAVAQFAAVREGAGVRRRDGERREQREREAGAGKVRMVILRSRFIRNRWRRSIPRRRTRWFAAATSLALSAIPLPVCASSADCRRASRR
jgi:hypothetical protein